MTAICSPARLAGGEVLVRIRDAGIMLFAVFVLWGVRIWVAAEPELLDELVAFLIVAQALERLHLLVSDDPAHVLIDPLLVLPLQLVLQRFVLGNPLLVTQRALQRVGLFRRHWPPGHAVCLRNGGRTLLRRCGMSHDHRETD